jgi:hypothetical protein
MSPAKLAILQSPIAQAAPQARGPISHCAFPQTLTRLAALGTLSRNAGEGL